MNKNKVHLRISKAYALACRIEQSKRWASKTLASTTSRASVTCKRCLKEAN